MKTKDIKVGGVYRTTAGVGLCWKTDGYHPPVIVVDIFHPFAMGRRMLPAKDVIEPVDILTGFDQDGADFYDADGALIWSSAQRVKDGDMIAAHAARLAFCVELVNRSIVRIPNR